MRKRWRDLVHIVHGGIFQCSGGIALRVAHDDATGRVRSLGGDSCQSQHDRIGQSHVPVIATHKYGRVRGDRIDQFLGGHLGRGPFGFIPVAARDPLPFWCLLRCSPMRRANSCGAGGVVELHAVERPSAVNKMHMRVVKAWQQ